MGKTSKMDQTGGIGRSMGNGDGRARTHLIVLVRRVCVPLQQGLDDLPVPLLRSQHDGRHVVVVVVVEVDPPLDEFLGGS